MAVDIKQLPLGGRIDDFLDVVDYIYRSDPAFVRPLDMDLKDRLSPKKNPFFEHGEAALFCAYRNGKPVGRCTASIDREHLDRYKDATGFFGFLDTVDDDEVARELLARAETWLRGKGMKRSRGPLSLNINEELGCLVEGFDTPPYLMMPHHRSYQGGLIERAGYEKAKDFYAWSYKVGEMNRRVRKAHDEIKALPEVSVRQMSLSNMQRDVDLLLEIFNETWSENWGYVPSTRAEARKMASDFKMLLMPDITCIVSIDGEPAAFALALPNLNGMIKDLHGALLPVGLPKLLWRLKVQGPKSARLILLGIRKKYRLVRKYAGLSVFMYAEMNDGAKRLGIREGELSWTLEDNGRVNAGIALMGAKHYKTYRVYEKALTSGRGRSGAVVKVLVTGATGFLGGHVAEQLAARGDTVRAMVRKTSNKKHLESLRGVELFEGSVEQSGRVREAVDGVDAIVHCAGIVKARSADEFFTVNVGGTSNLVDAARKLGKRLRRLVHVSSLEAVGPSADGRPVPADQENPVTAYGRSKLAAEKVVLAAKNDIGVTILRPSGIYGPRDVEVLELIKPVQRGLFPVVNGGRSKGVWVYATDCAAACIRAIEATEVASGRAFFVDDGCGALDASAMFADFERALGKKAMRASLPTPLFMAVARGVEVFGRVSGKAVMLTREKAAMLLQDWVCSSEDTRKELGWEPKVPWSEGVPKAVAWYRENGWL